MKMKKGQRGSRRRRRRRQLDQKHEDEDGGGGGGGSTAEVKEETKGKLKPKHTNKYPPLQKYKKRNKPAIFRKKECSD